jgi:hypothetical protein
MRLWAAKQGLVTQMGNQIHSAVEYRLATRLLREGVIGKVKEVHSWVAVLDFAAQMISAANPAAAATPSPISFVIISPRNIQVRTELMRSKVTSFSRSMG